MSRGRREADSTDAGGSVAAATGAGNGFTITVVLIVVEVVALSTLVVLRRAGLVADEPLWAYALAIGGSSLVSKRLDRWIDAPRGSWRLHARVLWHSLTVMVVIYL